MYEIQEACILIMEVKRCRRRAMDRNKNLPFRFVITTVIKTLLRKGKIFSGFYLKNRNMYSILYVFLFKISEVRHWAHMF